jgi:hypothetical protein
MIRSLLFGFVLSIAAIWTALMAGKIAFLTKLASSSPDLGSYMGVPVLMIVGVWSAVVIPMLLLAIAIRPWGQ